ncbi:MAG TPA: ATP-binding protein [Ktedonobacterales bacterium]|nr:ATP-binding protein [Ktedonobacterales bacterium]
MTETQVEELRSRDDAGYMIVDEHWRILASDERNSLSGDANADSLTGQSAYDVLGADVIAALERHGVASFALDNTSYVLTINQFQLPSGLIRVVRAQEEQATIERVMSLIVHEVRNPLSAMRALAQGLDEAVSLDETGQGYVKRLTDEIDRLSRLLASMSQVARLRAQPMRQLEPAMALDRVAMMFEPEASRRGVTIVTHVTPRVAPIRADADLIQQMLVNLVMNALQAMPNGGTLTLRSRLDPRGRTVIQVEDTGVGMSTERMQVAMRPGQSSKPGGMGLGLMVVRSIVSQHRARMRMTSAPGRGSLVSITFPEFDSAESVAPDAVDEIETGPLTHDGEGI